MSAIYRRWSSKAELVVAAVRALQASSTPPDTGVLREDLLAAAMHFAGPDPRAARVLASLLGEIGRDPELHDVARRTIGAPPVEALEAVIHRWIARGVVPEDAPVSLIAGIVPTAAFGSISLRRQALEPEVVAQLVDLVMLPALRVASVEHNDR